MPRSLDVDNWACATGLGSREATAMMWWDLA